MALARTVVLGCIAVALGIWWLGRAYEVEDAKMLGYLLSSVAFVAFTAILGVAGAAVLRAYYRRRRTNESTPRGPGRRRTGNNGPIS